MKRFANTNLLTKAFVLVVTGMMIVVFGMSGALAAKEKPAAKVEKYKSSSQISKRAVSKEKEKVRKLKEELNRKAVEAVANTYKAIELLDKNKPKEALKILKDAIGELEITLEANKDIALVPVDSYSILVDTTLTPSEIKKEIKRVKELLDTGDVQEARRILNTLQSEIDIVIKQLPLATYPDAIKLASKYIIDGKIKEAKTVLEVALNSLVIKTVVIPLPIVRAADLITEASKTARVDKNKAIEYLDEAKKQLQIAKFLGYGPKQEKAYKELRQKINNIEKEIKGKNKTEKLFDELIQKMKDLKKHLEKM